MVHESLLNFVYCVVCMYLYMYSLPEGCVVHSIRYMNLHLFMDMNCMYCMCRFGHV